MMLRVVLLATVAQITTTNLAPGWVIGATGQSCTDACQASGRGECEEPLVDNEEQALFLARHLGLPCPVWIPGRAAGQHHTGSCFYNSPHKPEIHCNEGIADIQLFCCCGGGCLLATSTTTTTTTLPPGWVITARGQSCTDACQASGRGECEKRRVYNEEQARFIANIVGASCSSFLQVSSPPGMIHTGQSCFYNIPDRGALGCEVSNTDIHRFCCCGGGCLLPTSTSTTTTSPPPGWVITARGQTCADACQASGRGECEKRRVYSEEQARFIADVVGASCSNFLQVSSPPGMIHTGQSCFYNSPSKTALHCEVANVDIHLFCCCGGGCELPTTQSTSTLTTAAWTSSTVSTGTEAAASTPTTSTGSSSTLAVRESSTSTSGSVSSSSATATRSRSSTSSGGTGTATTLSFSSSTSVSSSSASSEPGSRSSTSTGTAAAATRSSTSSLTGSGTGSTSMTTSPFFSSLTTSSTTLAGTFTSTAIQTRTTSSTSPSSTTGMSSQTTSTSTEISTWITTLTTTGTSTGTSTVMGTITSMVPSATSTTSATQTGSTTTTGTGTTTSSSSKTSSSSTSTTSATATSTSGTGTTSATSSTTSSSLTSTITTTSTSSSVTTLTVSRTETMTATATSLTATMTGTSSSSSTTMTSTTSRSSTSSSMTGTTTATSSTTSLSLTSTTTTTSTSSSVTTLTVSRTETTTATATSLTATMTGTSSSSSTTMTSTTSRSSTSSSTTGTTTATSSTTSSSLTSRTTTTSTSSSSSTSTLSRTETVTGTATSVTTTMTETSSSSSTTLTSTTSRSSTSSSATSTSSTSSVTSTGTTSTATVSSSTTSSSTASTTTEKALAPTELVALVDEQEQGLVTSFLSANTTMTKPVVMKTEGALLVAFELNASAEETKLEVEGTKAKVAVPSSVLEITGEVDSRAIFVVSVLDAPVLGGEADEEEGTKGSSGADSKGTPVKVSGVISVNLFAGSGSKIPLKDLAKPIVLTLPVNQTPGSECAYWDEVQEIWSTEGLVTRPPGEDGLMVCATSHLTIFAAIVRGFVLTIMCANLHVLSEEGLKALWSTDWYKEPVALLYWFFLLILAGTFIAASYVDNKRSKHGAWTDESFLIPLTDREEEELCESQGLSSPHASISSIVFLENRPEASRSSLFSMASPSRLSQQSTASPAGRPDVSRASLFSAASGGSRMSLHGRERHSATGLLPQATGDMDTVEERHRFRFSKLSGSLRASFWSSQSPESSATLSNFDFSSSPRPSRTARISKKMKALVPRNSGEAAGAVGGLLAETARSRFSSASASSVMTGFGKCVKFLKKTDAVKGAFGDLCSRWCEGFQHVQTTAGHVCSGFNAEGAEAGGGLSIPAVSKKILGSLLANYARKQTAASLGLSQEVVTFLTEDQELQKLLIEAARTKRGQNTEFLAHMRVWMELHAMVVKSLSRNYRHGVTWDNLPHSFMRLFWTSNPFVASFLGCNMWSCRLRVLFWSMEIMGAVMVATIFIQVSGMASAKQQPEGCDLEREGLYEQLGRLMAIGAVAVVVAHIPLALLFTLHSRRIIRVDHIGSPTYQRWLRIWKAQDTILWCLGLLYIASCSAFIAIFVANVAHEDLLEWGLTSLSAVVEDLFMVPMGVGLSVPITSMACLSVTSWWRGATRQVLVETQLEERSFSGGTWFRVCESI